MKETTAERLKKLMDMRGLKQADVIRMCQSYCTKFGAKFNKSDMSQYMSGKVKPSQYKLTILGHALDVQESWLMGFDVPMERKDKKITPSTEIDEEEKLMLDLFRCVPDDKKALVIAMIRTALNNQ